MRYIHLNPLHSGLVADLNGLDRYAYSGHSALMGGADRGWHATGTVLALFGRKLRAARKSYRSFVEQGMGEGRRADLTGGGLRRSVDGWSQVRALLRAKVFHKSDERILGDSDFVEDVLAAVADRTALDPAAIVSHSRERKKVAARSLLCFWRSTELQMPLVELSRRLSMTPSAVSLAGKNVIANIHFHIIVFML